MSRVFAISGGWVDLGARCVVRADQVERLAFPEVLLLGRLLRSQRTLVDVEELARAVGADSASVAEVWLLVARLQQVLTSPEGARTVLRIRSGEAVGLWPSRSRSPAISEAVLVGVGFDARRLAFREAPEGTESRWLMERARWERWAEEHGGEAVEEGAAAMAILLPPAAELLRQILTMVDASPCPTLRVAIHAASWLPGARDQVLRHAITQLSPLWERACRGHVLVSESARRVLRRWGSARPIGALSLEIGGPLVPVWGARGLPRLLPAAAEAVLPVMLPLPERLGELQAVLAALEGGAGLVVLHGSMGAGKTDLALTVADRARVRLRGRGGVRFVRLPALFGNLAELVASELGMAGAPDEAEAVARALQNLGESLLVLDGFERAGPEAQEIVQLWRARAPRCAVLITSPEPLRLPGAIQVQILPWSETIGAEALTRRLARTGLTLAPSQAALARRVSAVVGGQPHGIAVAAGLIAKIGLEESAQELQATSDAEVLPERQLSMALERARRHLSASLADGLDRLSVLRGDFDSRTAEVVLEESIGASECLRNLTEAGLIRQRLHATLGEHRFSVPGPVRELTAERLPRAERRRLRHLALSDLARRGVGWSREIESGADEQRALQRLLLARDECLLALGTPIDDLDLDRLVLGLLRLTELGRLGLGQLDQALVGVASSPVVALARARARLAAGSGQQALRWAEEAQEGGGAVGDEARIVVLHATAPRVAEARLELSRIVDRWLSALGPGHLGAAGAVLDALLAYGMAGDAQVLGERLSSLAARHGSTWRAGVIHVHLFRARALSGVVRERDRRGVVATIDQLQRLGDHRTAATALHWMVRHETATGQPELGLVILDRVQSYLDTYASAAVQQLLVLDRARALTLAGRAVEARQTHASLEALSEVAGRLPFSVRALDAVMIEIVDGRPEAARLLLKLVDEAEAPPAYLAIADLLLVLCQRWLGQHTPLPAPRGRLRRGERVLRDLVQAWDEPRELAVVVRRARAHPSHRSLDLMGVILRGLVTAAARFML